MLPVACEICPRKCGANRAAGERGLCGADDTLMVARSALHYWEEPPVSGHAGSGTIFFAHCPLHCLYCQNAKLAAGRAGRAVTVERLAQMCLELQVQGALNINFVTPTHYALQVREAVKMARQQGLVVPVVWNTGGYETVESIRANKGAVDVYLTDFKYSDANLAMRYSRAKDYPEVAQAALDAMVEQVGEPVFDQVDGASRITRGVIVRHLLLPGALDDSKRVVKRVYERYGQRVLLSLMNQYTPVLSVAEQAGDREAHETLQHCPELARRVPHEEYEELLDFADDLGVQDYFWQEGETAEESFIPSFDCTGV